MRKYVLSFFAGLLLTSCGSDAQPAQQPVNVAVTENPIGCGRFFYSGKMPVFQNEKSQQKTRILCRRSYALLHSGVARQALWVAEYLTKEQIKMGQSIPRIDNFKPDEEIPYQERSELKDYSKSGYDRGHLAPDADMPSWESSQESFLLSNMSPQKPNLNRKSWADLEASVRKQTLGGPVYVVTGPLFAGTRLATTKKDKRLLVPTHFYKAVYAVDRGATVFVATNQDKPKWMTLSVNQFNKIYGLNPFPALPPQMQNINGSLNGSMSQITAAASANGATTSTASTTGTTTQTRCKAEGDKIVRNPTNNMVITPQQYRLYFGRDPDPQDYCEGYGAGNRSSSTTTSRATATGPVDAGPPGACKANGSSNVRNPTNNMLITPEQYRNYFGRDPLPEEYCQ